MSRWLRRCSQSLIEMNSSQSSLQQGRTKATPNGLSRAVWQLEHQSISGSSYSKPCSFSLFSFCRIILIYLISCLQSTREKTFLRLELKPSLRKSLSGTGFWIKVKCEWKGLCFICCVLVSQTNIQMFSSLWLGSVQNFQKIINRLLSSFLTIYGIKQFFFPE